MNKEEFVDHKSGKMSMSMGTCDLEKNPTFSRVWGVHFSDASRAFLKVILPEKISQKPLAHLAINKNVSITVGDMIQFKTNQYKGVVEAIEQSTPEEIAIAKESRDNSTDTLVQFFGEVGNNWSKYTMDSGLTLTIKITEVYDQTPGKMAGVRLL
ncbi:MAG: hypothetical protein RIC35_01505 [Marinoscillum sp.]